MIPMLQWPIYSGWVWNSPVVPNMYWNVYSSEQRWKNMCLNIGKMSAYLDNVAEQTNTWVDDVSQYVDGRIQNMEEQVDDFSEFATEHGYDALVGFLPTTTMKDTRQTDIMQEYDSVAGVNRNVAYPPVCVSNRSGMMNPLPMLRLIYGYMHSTDLKYGNEYTGTNVNETYTAWNPAVSNKDPNDNKMMIDCATFCLMLTLGIDYGLSSYVNASFPNLGCNDYINMFHENTKKYILSPNGYGNDPTAVTPQHRRLLGSEWAKLLYDNGMLRAVHYHGGVAALAYTVHPGDILFFSNDPATNYKWQHIGHCAVVAAVAFPDIILAESDRKVGPYNTGVQYTILHATNDAQSDDNKRAQSVRYIFTPNEFPRAENDVMDGLPMTAQSAVPFDKPIYNLVVGASQQFSRKAFRGGYAVIYNTTDQTQQFTYKLTIPYRSTEQSTVSTQMVECTKTLPPYNSFVVILPPDVSFANDAQGFEYTVKFCNICTSIDATPYIPA